jgi:hypothetical protein
VQRFLVREATASTLDPVAHRRPQARRVVAAGAVAACIGLGIVAAGALVGGPGAPAPAAAVAVATEDGWTTVRVLDPDADPADILADLEAAGIEASIKVVPPLQDGDTLHVSVGPEESGVGTAMATMEPGRQGLIGLTVNTPDISFGPSPADAGHPDEHLVEDGEPPEGEMPDPAAEIEAAGVRHGEDMSISIRDGSDNVVVLLVAE